MKVGGGCFGFFTLGGRPLAARRLARMRFLYCFQSQAQKIKAHMAITAALETMAEMMGVLARWLFEREVILVCVCSFCLSGRDEMGQVGFGYLGLLKRGGNRLTR